MKTTLLIMAAGIGSRFGTGIKQLEPVDASNHIIMDYSIHDAIEAGFKFPTGRLCTWSLLWLCSFENLLSDNYFTQKYRR